MSIFFYSLFTLTATFIAPLVISFTNFLYFFLLPFRRYRIYFLCTMIASFYAF
jgi:hypothetical protein